MDPNHLTRDNFKNGTRFPARATDAECHSLYGSCFDFAVESLFSRSLSSFSFVFLSARRGRLQKGERAGFGSFGCGGRSVRNGAQAN
jgi:hypothetical protein